MNMRILIAAGLACSVSLTPGTAESAETRNPTHTASMIDLRLSSPRATHASVHLADGRVLLIGGCAGSCDAGPGSSTVDMFDPATHRVTRAGKLAHSRISAAAVALDGNRVLILGGYSNGAATASAEIYDTKTNTSRAVASMSNARGVVDAIRLNDGRVLVTGGIDYHKGLTSSETFDPATERFTPSSNLTQARSGAELTMLSDGRVLVTGGMVNGAVTASAEIFDPRHGKFHSIPAMLEARYKHAAVALPDGRVLIVGGATERDYAGKKRSLEFFDPNSQIFYSAGTLHTARFKIPDAVTVLDDGRVFIAGGAPRPEIFDPKTRTATQLDIDLAGSWSFMTANRIQGDRVLLAGGYSEGKIDVTSRARLIQL